MKKEHLIIIAISITLLLVGTTSLVYSLAIIDTVVEYDMDLTVDPSRAGMNGDPGIHFGVIPPGSSSKKKIDAYNPHDYSVEGAVKLSGDLGEWVIVSPLPLYLEPQEKKVISLNAVVPGDASSGDYTGKIKIILKRK